MQKLLLLGGTTEASRLARLLADRWQDAGRQAVFSYAGRTARPAAQPLRQRLGGFGGVAGLVDYIRGEGISHVVDATHPFAAQMSAHAVMACAQTQTPLCALQRAPWAPEKGDCWTDVASIEAAVRALPEAPAKVFLAIGKLHLAAFAAQPQHDYLLRLVDPPEGVLPLPRAEAVIARGPFDVAGDTALLRGHGITHVVAKNAGGTGASAKLAAARAVGAEVIMIDRPFVPERLILPTPEAVLRWLCHAPHSAPDLGTEPGAKRGV